MRWARDVAGGRRARHLGGPLTSSNRMRGPDSPSAAHQQIVVPAQSAPFSVPNRVRLAWHSADDSVALCSVGHNSSSFLIQLSQAGMHYPTL